MKNTITGYEVEEETDDEENNKTLWLKLMLNNTLKMTLGVVYVRPEGYDNRLKNSSLIEKMKYEAQKYQEKGFNIVILGDFNGHVTKTTCQDEWIGANFNGNLLMDMVKTCKLQLIN